jgi:hypothetical protein
MTNDRRHDLRCGFDTGKGRHLFASGLVFVTGDTDPLKVRVLVSSALGERDDVIDLERFRPIADLADRIPSEDLGSKLHPAMSAVWPA